MMRRTISLVLFFALKMSGQSQITASASPIQDQVKIDNERVTVSDITLTPQKPETIETHNHDFVTMYLIGGKFRTVGASGASHIVMHNAGDATFTSGGSKTVAEVVSDQPARIFVVELKQYPVTSATNSSKYPDAFPRPGSTKVLENEHVVVWNYSWAPGVPTPMHYHFREVVVVYRENGSLKSTSVDGESVVNNYTFGMVKFNKADRTHTEELEKGKESAIIVELK
jgi:hypothetical protein